MRLITCILLLNCSAFGFAHSLTDNPDTLASRLHVLLSPHHLPMLLILAIMIIAISVHLARLRRPR